MPVKTAVELSAARQSGPQNSYLRAVRQLAAYFKKPPDQITEKELRQILARVRRWRRTRVCLSTIYACGLPLQEGLHLQISQLDGARPMAPVCQGKGGTDRYVPLPQPVLEMLHQYWSTSAPRPSPRRLSADA